MQEYGVNYYKTHAPVMTWFAIWLMIVFSILFNRAMRRKPNLTTGEIVKHKARLNLHGGMQAYGVNY